MDSQSATPSKSGPESGRFQKGRDPRRGRGPKPGAPNAGPPPKTLTLLARELIDRHQLFVVAAKIACAELGEQYAAGDGTVVHTDTRNSDRLAAIKLLAQYAEAMPQAPATSVTVHNYLLEAPPKTPSPEAWREQFAGRN